MARLLANENFPAAAVQALQARGHDVVWVRTEMPGSADEAVLARAVADGRILLTFDKDFGELAFRSRLPAACGVLLFRVTPVSASHVARVAVAALASRMDWAGQFAVVVVEDDRVRLAPLPPAREPDQ